MKTNYKDVRRNRVVDHSISCLPVLTSDEKTRHDGDGRRIQGLFSIMLLMSLLLTAGRTHGWPDVDFCNEEFSVCGESENGSCFEVRDTPGCCDPDCCRIVCEIDSLCCEDGWDEFCVSYAEAACHCTTGECGTTPNDCNNNCLGDACDLDRDSSLDCNENGIIDSCEVADGIAEDCNGNSIPDECDLANQDCNQNGIIDFCESQGGIETDCNGNGKDEVEEGPTFCPSDSLIPVDLIVVADSSGSADGKFGDICEDVFRTAVERLGDEFDVRAAWTSMLSPAPYSACLDYIIPDGTPVPVCHSIPDRVIDSSEDWGDSAAAMTAPYGAMLLGSEPLNWAERDAVLIIIPASDEGPQDGNDQLGSCSCQDSRSVLNLIQQAILRNAQVIPMPTRGTPDCVYEPGDASSYMNVIATRTSGSVVDARSWPSSISSEQLSANLEAAIRAAIVISPRLVCTNPCPADFNGDGVVDGSDLAMLLGDWGLEGSAYDITGDGRLDGADLSIMLGTWGDC